MIRNEKKNQTQSKINMLRNTIIFSCVLAIIAFSTCVVCAICRFTLETPILDYVLAIVAFVGTITGVFIPVFIGQRNGLIKEQKELNDFIESVYDELSGYYLELSKRDVFSYDIPAWESLKANYIHFVGINKDLAENISNVYSKITRLNELAKEYSHSNDEQLSDKINILTECHYTKTHVLRELRLLLSPFEIAFYFDQNNKLSFDFFCCSSDNEDEIYKIIDTIVKNNFEDNNFDLNNDFFNKFKKLFLDAVNEDNHFKYKITMLGQNHKNMLISFIMIPKEFFSIQIINSKLVKIDNGYFGYLDIVPILLLLDDISPAQISYNLRIKNYSVVTSLITSIPENDNFCYFLLQNNCLKDVVLYFINNNVILLLIFVLKIINLDKFASDEESFSKYNLQIWRNLFDLSSGDFAPERKLYVSFLKNYAQSIVNKEYIEFDDYKPSVNSTVTTFMPLIYDTLLLNDDIFEKAKKKYGKNKLAEKCFSIINSINKMRNDYLSPVTEFSKGEHYFKNSIIYPILRTIPLYYQKLKELGFEESSFDYNSLIFESSVDAIAFTFNKNKNKLWNYSKYYTLSKSIKNIFLCAKDPDDILKKTAFNDIINEVLDISNRYKNTVFEEVYLSLFYNIIRNSTAGILSAMKKVKYDSAEYKNLLTAKEKILSIYNVESNRVNRFISKVNFNGNDLKSSLYYEAMAFDDLYSIISIEEIMAKIRSSDNDNDIK